MSSYVPVVKILIADDQQLVREALAALLCLEPDIEVIALCSTGEEAVDNILALQPDVALLDIEMSASIDPHEKTDTSSSLSGIDVVRRIREAGSSCATLIVTTFGRPGYLTKALEAGANGFVVKDTPASQLAESIRRVHEGLSVVDPSLAAQALTSGKNPLTSQEIKVLKEAFHGTSIKGIARLLSLSQGTVRNYLSSIISKLQADNRYDAARIAQEKGWML